MKIETGGIAAIPPAPAADLNDARAEINALINAASAVALGGKKDGQGNEAIRSDFIARLARSLRRAKAAIKSSATTKPPIR